MKRIVLLTSTFCFFWSFSMAKETIPIRTGCKTDTLPTLQLITFLQQMNVESYYGKPVDSFLTVLPTMYNSIVVQSLGNLKYARIIKVKYPENVRVLIFVKNFQYMNPRSETSHWDINLFKKENLACIEIWQGNNRVTTQCKYWE